MANRCVRVFYRFSYHHYDNYLRRGKENKRFDAGAEKFVKFELFILRPFCGGTEVVALDVRFEDRC